IDQIWTSTRTTETLIRAEIIPSNGEINTDHHVPMVKLRDIYRLPDKFYYDRRQESLRYNVTNVKPEQWQKFTDTLPIITLPIDRSDYQKQWNILVSNITSMASKTLRIKKHNTVI